MNRQDAAASGYAYWVTPDALSKLVYSLNVFHEIDFTVGEGFRRIPHGGVETGGLLFGTSHENTVRVEAFRPIECEHALGPSFVLSERDIERLRQQMAEASSDPELEGWQPVGWFVAHTRSPLRMSDREAELFNQLFPAAGSVAVLVKPERFQPTRFGFLMRNTTGQIERDATSHAVILPLPGRTAPGDEAVPSLPAPEISAVPQPEPQPKKSEAPLAAQSPPPSVTASKPMPRHDESGPAVSRPAYPLAPEVPAPIVAVAAPAEVPQPAASIGTSARPAARTEASSTSAGAAETAPAPAHTDIPQLGPITPSMPVLPPLPPRTEAKRQAALLGWRFGAVLILAAVLGCLTGYWFYLQLPSPVIPLTVREQRGQIILAWPAAQTNGVSYAAIRINDGLPKTLTDEEKAAGELTLADSSGDLKVELVAQHWLRDSHGIVRYLKTPQGVR